ncbi:MAG: hypothetical protein HYZ36_00570 [Pedosphaera parvula]|nr:hypothetical protein [Pedosphaera parvula]
MFLGFACAGCVSRAAVRAAAPLMERGLEAVSEEEDVRLAESASGANLKILEAALKEDPRHARLLLLACRGFAGYALVFVGDEESERARAFYARARAYGLRALEQDRRLRGLLSMPMERLEKVLKACTRKDVPKLFWATLAWGYWINLSRDKPEALAELPRAEAIMRRVLELDEAYFYGGPHLFFGTIYGSRTKLLGGDPDRAREHLERNLKLNGGRFLLTYYFYARYLAVQLQDRQLFERLLRQAAEAPAESLPDQRLLNTVARGRCADLLAHADEYF